MRPIREMPKMRARARKTSLVIQVGLVGAWMTLMGRSMVGGVFACACPWARELKVGEEEKKGKVVVRCP